MMIPHNPPPVSGMGLVIPFPSVAPDRLPGASARAPRRRFDLSLSFAERALDFVTVMSFAILTWQGYVRIVAAPQATIANTSLINAAALFAIVFILRLEKHGEYRPYLSLLAVRETERLLRVSIECLLFAVPIAYFAAPQFPRAILAIIFIIVPTALLLEKAAFHVAVRRLRRLGYGTRKTVILGAGPLARNIYSALVRSPKIGLDPGAIVDEEAALEGVEIHASSYHCRQSVMVLAGPLSARLFHNVGASVLIIADPNVDGPETTEIMSRAAMAGVSTYVASRDYMQPGYWLEYSEIDGMMLGQVTTDRPHIVYELAKRALDVIAASVALVLLAPLIAILALLVRCTSRGPIFFKQQRVGSQGRIFGMYKFRSMYIDTPAYEYSPKNGTDCRITPIGRLLRRTCLDELPQLWNVLRGDMSLVGPRPEMPFIVARYTAFQQQRLAVKPGITGLWQLSGDRNYLIHENIEYDLYYIRNRNIFMDIAVLLHSVIFAARGI